MSTRRKLLITAAAVLALGAGGVGIAQAVSGDDEQVTGPAADRAKSAALESVGGGRATAVERDDDSGYVFVVVRRDGSNVEVSLDADGNVVGTETEDEKADDEGKGEERDSEDGD
jgi:hypothetical protein